MAAPNETAAKTAPPEAGEVVIRVRDIVTRFGDKVIHDGLSLDIRRGEIIGIVGGSGTGKSVLLREIIGLMQPAAGTVEVLGRKVHLEDGNANRELEKLWGVLFQEGALFSSLTVAQNVKVPLKENTELDAALIDEITRVTLAMVGLPPDAGAKFPSELSGGMKKRAGLARALALSPQILFLDEPTAGLDPIGAANFDRLIQELHKSLGFTVVMVTHDLDSLITICHRIAVLIEKQIVVGTLDELLRSEHPWIQSYFKGPRGRAALRQHAAPEAA
jgi:phospholipid/cholesterol/gamma-HCH transport system ATP-binding protein